LFICTMILFAGGCQDNNTTKLKMGTGIDEQRPKLVIGIVVDQMRPDYLYRFADKYGEGGFKRLMKSGFVNKNIHFNYVPTFTAPGHASIFTGTTPEIHGIIANDWYSKVLKREIYCTEDSLAQPIGTKSNHGKMSPRNLLVTTITDELKLSTNHRGKVVGISLKDRGAIFPAGHMADAAYWYDLSSGNFITSNFYREELPGWVEDFNDRKLSEEFLNQVWNTLLPIEEYVESSIDNTHYEKGFGGKETPEFPYNLKELRKMNDQYELLAKTPFGNTILTELAKATIKGEELGKDKFTDFLTLSYSSPDKLGHEFGLRSIELQDMYMRLDLELESLLKYLDKEVGKGNYLIFLTADHAAAETPLYLTDLKVPAGYYYPKAMKLIVQDFVSGIYGEGEWIENLSNDQVFFNRRLMRERGLDVEKIQRQVAEFVLEQEGVSQTYSGFDIQRGNYTEGTAYLLKKGYNSKRSGDVLIVYEPAWINFYTSFAGTTHGSCYSYDTHVPLIWYGWNIKAGETAKRYEIVDIAPTLSMLLNINIPNGSAGKVIEEVANTK
jgi:predicted AlkP superfamily pyrophosphatase or phosphodiesterase